MFVFLMIIVFSNSLHEFHVAKTDIIINSEKHQYEVSQFVFLDDLQDALSLKGYKNLDLCTESEQDSSDYYIIRYMRENLQLSVDNQSLDSITFLGKKASDDLSGVYIQFLLNSTNTNPQEILIKNTIFTEIFDDQKNVIYITHADDKKDYLLLDSDKNEEFIKR